MFGVQRRALPSLITLAVDKGSTTPYLLSPQRGALPSLITLAELPWIRAQLPRTVDDNPASEEAQQGVLEARARLEGF